MRHLLETRRQTNRLWALLGGVTITAACPILLATRLGTHKQVSEVGRYPDDADGQVLAEIAAIGTDMTKPHQIHFPIDAPNERSARAIESLLIKQGFTTHFSYDEGQPDKDGHIDTDDAEFGPSWTVYVKVDMVPSHEEIVRMESRLDELVRGLGGKTGGWGMFTR